MLAIWMRFPHVSSKTAVVTGPIAVGGWVNSTPAAAGGRARPDVGHRERRERDPVGDEGALERPDGGMAVGLEHELHAVGILGETTVSHLASPAGRSVSSRSRARR